MVGRRRCRRDAVSGEAGDMYDWTCRWEDGRWKLGLPHRDGRECGTIARCAIWASSPTDIWCSESRRWDGDQIVSVPGAGALQFNDRDIWGSSSDDIWVLGESGWMGHSDGRGISGEQIPGADALDLRRIHGAGSSALWAVGPGGILRRSGADWVIEPVPDPALQPISVAVGADDDAVVGGARGRLFAYDAGSWTDLSIPPPVADPRHVWGASTTEVWLGGRGMARWDGSSWTPVDLGPDVSDPSVRDLLGFADDDVWAILYQSPSQTRLAHYDGVSWTSQSSLDLGIDLLANLHGRAADDLWLSGVGSTGFVVAHWSGVSWTRINLPPDASAPLSMWSASATEVWVAWAEQHPSGEFFISWLARWDGSTWQIDELDHALVRDVFGFAADDVWACGDNGWLAHWDGTAWTTVASNTDADLMSLWGTSPTALWATGGRTDGADSSRNGVILRWDGNTWSPEAIPHRDNVTSVFGVGNVMWGTGDFLMRKQAM